MPKFITTKKLVEARTFPGFASAEDAIDALHGYFRGPAQTFRNAYGARSSGESNVVALAAAQRLVSYLTSTLGADPRAFGVNPIASSGTVPTWTDSEGRTTPLSDMPTPYLRRVLPFALRMTELKVGAGQGLAAAIEAELRKRQAQESEAA